MSSPGGVPATADLCDAHGDALRVVQPPPLFRDLGGARRFAGRVATVRVRDDNTLVRAALAEPGDGRVLVVDGGGSLRCALLGDRLAQLAVDHGWSGVVVSGCIRDSAAVAGMALGVKAIATHPRRSAKGSLGGERDVPLTLGGVAIVPGDWLCADEDGIVIATAELDV